MRWNFLSSFTAICLLAGAGGSRADTIILLTGEKIEGRITSETSAEVQVEEKISSGITDSRTIKRADIQKIEKEAPDITAWQPLQALKPAANSLPAASYEAAIAALNNFSSQFPQSVHTADAKKFAAEFAAEKKRVDAGDVKLNGQWLSKEAVQVERYQIGGLLAFNRMKELSNRDLIGALNSFDALEKNFPAARIFPDAVDLAKRLVAAVKTDVDRRLLTMPAFKADREKTIRAANPAQKKELLAEDARNAAAATTLLTAMSTQNVKWPPLNGDSEPILRALSSRISSEMPRLLSLPVAKMRESIAAAEKAKAALAQGDLPLAESTLGAAVSAWNVNELALRLQKDLATAKAAAVAKPEPVAPAATPAPAPIAAAPESAPSTPATVAPEPIPAEEEEETSFLRTPAGLVTLIILGVLLIAGWITFKKIKGRANEVLE